MIEMTASPPLLSDSEHGRCFLDGDEFRVEHGKPPGVDGVKKQRATGALKPFVQPSPPWGYCL